MSQPLSRPPQRRRLFIHVGLQKTGTSYLQAVLLENAATLATQGLDLVPASKRESFELMLQVRERYQPGRDPDSVGEALDRFTAALAEAPGDSAVVSQESLAAARPDQLRRLLDACGDREVHVVVTARDLGRGLPSSWQQELKSGRTPTYEEWLDRLQDLQEGGRARHPWIHLDPVAVLDRWRALLPAHRLHLVTVPPSGSSPTLLLERFCRVLGVDPAGLGTRDRAANTSLGREQAELLRRVNAGLPDDVRRRQVYGDVGKRYLASRVLGSQQGRRIVVPEERRAWVERVAEEQVTALGGAGYDVVGSLEDLRPDAAAFSADELPPTPEDVADAAIVALTTVVELRGRQQRDSGAPGPVEVSTQGVARRLWRRLRR